MESQLHLAISATPARAALVSVLNPGIDVIGDYYGSATLASATPKTIEFVVLSQAGVKPFAPLSALVPGTIKVDGVSFRDVSIRPDPIDVNADGIPDAIVTVSTRSALRLPVGLGLLTVTGTTRFRAAGHPVVWASSAAIDVLPSGAGSGGQITLYNGYINIINDTGGTVYDSLLTNTPPGGNVTPYPGTYVRAHPGYYTWRSGPTRAPARRHSSGSRPTSRSLNPARTRSTGSGTRAT